MAMKGKQSVVSLYLPPEKLDAVNELAAVTRIKRNTLLQEAVDDLLMKHDDVGGGYAVVRKKKAKAAKAKR